MSGTVERPVSWPLPFRLARLLLGCDAGTDLGNVTRLRLLAAALHVLRAVETLLRGKVCALRAIWLHEIAELVVSTDVAGSFFGDRGRQCMTKAFTNLTAMVFTEERAIP